MSRVVAKGRFRVDRRRALEKLERFQLEDPLRYVLEWLAAAVVSGAARVDIRNDSDDFEIAWDGVRVRSDELDTLFDHLFGRPKNAQQAMLQHLAVGVLGALAREPRWLHVDGASADGALRLAVDDPVDCAAEVLDEPLTGMRCHVRDRLTHETALEALLLAFRDPGEARIIRGAARWCQVPVYLNGTALPPPAPPASPLLAWSSKDAMLWVVPGETGHGVDVVRHGIVVHELPFALPPCRVVGWVRGDDVRLNASRSAVVDSDVKVALTQLGRAIDDMLAAELPRTRGDRAEEITWGGRTIGGPRARSTRGELLDALVMHGLLRGPAVAEALEQVTFLADLRGRRWSLASLRLESVGWVDDEGLLDWAERETVLFAAAHAHLLKRVKGARDVSHELRVRQAVERRRAALQQEAKMPWAIAGRPPQHGAVKMGAKIGMSVLPDSADLTRVHLLLDGVRLTTITTGGIGVGIEALVDAPFTLAGIDAEVRHDGVYQRALAAVADLRFPVVEAWLDGAETEAALRVLTRVARPVLGPANQRSDRLAALEGLPTSLRQRDLVPWQGRRWSLERMLAEAEPTFVVDRLPDGCPASVADKALVVPGRLVHDWAAWLDVDEPGRAAVDKAVRRAHKLAGPRQEARLVPPPRHRALVDADGLKGQLGHDGFDEDRSVAGRLARRAGGSVARREVTVLWQGVPVGSVAVEPLPGTFGVVNGHDLPLTDELALTPQARSRVEKWIRRGTLRLVLSLWDAVPEGERLPHALMEWLTRRQQHVPDVEARRPVLRRVGGEALTLHDLRALDRRKKGSRKLVVLRRHPGDVPGFEEAVVVSEAEHALLRTLSRRGWRDGDRDLADALEQLDNLTSLPAWQPPLRPLAYREVTGRGWRGRAYLPRDLEHAGRLEVVALFRGRRLSVRKATSSAGVWLVVEGLPPNRRCTDVRTPKDLTRLKGRAESLLIDMVEELIEGGRALEDLQAMRALAGRVKQAGQRDKRFAKLARKLRSLKLVTMLSGERRSPDQLAARRAAGKPVVRVAPHTRAGPTDHEGYVRNDPGVAKLLEAWLGGPVPDGTGGLTAWREGQRRRKNAPRATPRSLGGRAWPLDGAFTGFVSLREGARELVIEPICEQIALHPLKAPFPLGVTASVTGPSIEASTDWTRVTDPARVREGVRKAVEDRLDRAILDGELRGHDARTLAVHLGPDALAASAPLFSQVSGGPVSLADLATAGEAYTASHDRIVPPCGWSALLRPPDDLTTYVRLVSLDGLLALMDQSPRDLPPVQALAQQRVPEGLLWVSTAATPRIDVLIDRRVVARIPSPPGLALEGSVGAPEVEPLPDGSGLVKNAAYDALIARIEGWADGLVEQVAARLPHNDHARSALVRGLAAKLEQKKGLVRLRDRRDPLLSVPLFRDSTGTSGTLADVLDGDEVGWVDPSIRGAPPLGRWWALPTPIVRAVERVRRVTDRTADLKRANNGRRRREVAYELPSPPRRARHGRHGGAEWALWSSLRFAKEDTVDVVVDGAKVQSLDLGGGGVLGFVTGDFATDAAFREATLPEGLVERLADDAAQVLQQERLDDPARWMGRMSFLRKRGGRLDRGAASRVEVARDARGASLTVGDVVKHAGRYQWVVDETAVHGPRARRLVGTEEERRWLVHGLGVTLPVQAARVRKEALDLPVRQLVDLSKGALRKGLSEVPEDLRHVASDAGRWLLAWAVASRAVDDDDEIALLGRLVDRLRGDEG